MSFTLRRTKDGKGDSGVRSESIKWTIEGKFDKIDGEIPIIGNSMLVGSLSARSYSHQDYWLTTPIIEILEEIKNDDVHYIRFLTENSEYEWWTGNYPKQLNK